MVSFRAGLVRQGSAGRVRCASRAYAHIEAAVTALPTPSSPTPSAPPPTPAIPAAPSAPPAPLEFPLSWLLEFAPPPIQYRAAIEVARLPVSYTHLRAHETDSYLVCRLLLEKKNN